MIDIKDITNVKQSADGNFHDTVCFFIRILRIQWKLFCFFDKIMMKSVTDSILLRDIQ